jgi:hypothetical protein
MEKQNTSESLMRTSFAVKFNGFLSVFHPMGLALKGMTGRENALKILNKSLISPDLRNRHARLGIKRWKELQAVSL